MAKQTKKFNKSILNWVPLLGPVIIMIAVYVLLKGKDVPLLQPAGYIADQQYKLMLRAILIMLEIAIPTLTAFYFIAWKYRDSNHKAEYKPETKHHKSFVIVIWALPLITATLLAVIMWPATQNLSPQKYIDNGVKPLTIQVIAMRWKWLFIYPEQGIATVNYVQIPVNRPVQFELSADETPMSSFWIPKLAGQLYAMTGHVNQLNILAQTPGTYAGSNTEINGDGFSGMRFTAQVSASEEFDTWVQNVSQYSQQLDAATYANLLKPSQYNQPEYFANASSDIYANMLMKYSGSHSNSMEHK